MLEQLFIGLVFLAALFYLGRRVWNGLFRKETGCGKGCGCSTETTGTINKARIRS